MADRTHDQCLEAMLRTTGEWITLHTWQSEDDDPYDADGWLERWRQRVGTSQAPLPGGGFVDLTAFCAIRNGNI